MSDAAAEARVHVDRFHAEYAVPSAHPAPDRVRSRLDAVLRRDLPRIIRSALEPGPARELDGVWKVRRLHVDLDVNAAWDHERIARRWSARIARGLAETIAEARTGAANGVVRFDDRAAYLARFLADLAAGTAWDRWYYDEFDGLRPLPLSAALRTAVCRDPGAGLQALMRLDRGDRDRVVGAFTERDARRVLDAVPAGAAADDPAGRWRALRAAWTADGAAARAADDEARGALHLLLDAGREPPGLPGPLMRDAALALLRLARRLEARSPAERTELLRALRASDPAALYRVAGAADAEALRPLRDAPLALLRAVEHGATGSARTTRDRGTSPPDAAEGRRSTRFGGIFLLLPFVDELPLAEATADWPRAGSTAPAAAMRLLLLAKCHGRRRMGGVFGDPLARDIAGVDPALDRRRLRRWQAEVPRESLDGLAATFDAEPDSPRDRTALERDLRYLAAPESFGLDDRFDHASSVVALRVLRAFAERLPGFGGSSAAYIHANFLDVRASLEDEPERRVVRIGRPPLHLVLGLSGLARAEYRPSWMADRPFVLFPEGD